MQKKRDSYLSWDDYFMAIAKVSSMRSKDPNTQVGACVVDQSNRLVGIGYNGLPNGCSDDDFPWDREGDYLNTKYPYICHAELNALLNTGGKAIKGDKIYSVLFPCNECAKVLIQFGISEVIYLSDKHANEPPYQASKILLQKAGVLFRQLQPVNKEIHIVLDEKNI